MELDGNKKTLRYTQKDVSVHGIDVSVLYRNVADDSVQMRCTETTGIPPMTPIELDVSKMIEMMYTAKSFKSEHERRHEEDK